MNHQSEERRVVITGMGVIAANGQDLDTFWRSVRDGKSAGAFLTRFDCSKIPSKVGAEIMDFDPSRYIDPKHAKRLDRSLQYGVSAARLATIDAGVNFDKINADRTGVIEGTSLSNNVSAFETQDAYLKKGYRGVGVSALINGYSGSGCGEIANELGVKGHAITCSTSSSSGNDAMGYALSMIRHEDVDVMIAGGSEAPFIESVWSIFCLNKVMTRHSDNPATAMRPFDKSRDGFMLGEGAAYVVMEELAHALGRGAKIYCEVLSHGRSCEAYHALAPHPDGIGVTRALEKAIRSAGVHPSEVDYINAHGTATAANDVVETRGIKKFFGEYAKDIAISSTKPVTGHLMAGAGALETVICALSLYHQEIPMTLNLTHPDIECDLDYVAGKSRPYPVKIAVNLNCGFGGKNSCLVLGRYPPEK